MIFFGYVLFVEENQQKITSVKRMVDTAASEKAEQVVDSDDESDEEGKGNTPKDAAVADKRRSTAGTSTLLHATSKLNKKIKHVSYSSLSPFSSLFFY